MARATDRLDRALPTHADVGSLRPNKTVGLFYFIWHTEGNGGPYDNTQLLAAAGGNYSAVKYGPVGAFHHWGQPLFGYYLSDDRWVIRKHASQLADAGVDYICMDMTNALTYDDQWRAVFETFAEMRREGNQMPNIAIILHSNIAATLAHMYQTLWIDTYPQGFGWHNRIRAQVVDGPPLA